MAFTRTTSLTITSNSALLPATQTSFPVLVSLTHNDWKSVANGGYVQNASGYDIRFFSDAGLTTAIAFELESYNGTTGAIVFWVSIASCALSTVFYCGWGDAALTTNISSTAVWDSNYLRVYHMGDGTTFAVTDSTSNGVNGTLVNTPTAAAGQIVGAGSFASASTQYVTLGSAINPSTITVSMWLKATTFANTYEAVFSRNNASAGTSYFQILIKSSGKLSGWAKTASTVSYDGTGTITMVTGNWYHVSLSYDGTAGMAAYVNAAVDKTVPGAGGGLNTTTSPSRISSDSNVASREWNGLIDEVRISNSVRSANWITAEYNNQLNPATFVTIGTPALPTGTTGRFFPLMGA